jgi:uncharacterized membrane protein HdeD (DUF308 family)
MYAQPRTRVFVRTTTARRFTVIVIGLILLLLGVLVGIPVLWTLGVISLVFGLVMFALGSGGRPVAGRKHYW